MEYKNFFTEDLMIEILSRLPVTSLIRFRCVCKSWFIMFQESAFVNKHLKNSKNNNDHRRLLVGRRLSNVGTFMSLSYESLDVVNHDLRFRYYDGITSSINLWITYDLLGSFNGVICLSRGGGGGGVVFWNPATRQMKIVQESSVPYPPGFESHSMDYGFGYDFKANDYKVVKRTSFLDVLDNSLHRFEVYSLNSNSWHSIDNAVIPITGITFDEPDYQNSHYFVCQRAFMNGSYSRLVYIEGLENIRKYYVLTLDMTEEIFILTPVPDDEILIETPLYDRIGRREYKRHKALFPLKGSIALITFPSQYSSYKSYYGKSYEISVLDEYGPNGCWTKLYTGELFPGECIPLGFWKSGALFLENHSKELVMFDLRTREFKVLPSRDFGSLQLVEYTESLVSIN